VWIVFTYFRQIVMKTVINLRVP